jgi:hypothetical protein
MCAKSPEDSIEYAGTGQVLALEAMSGTVYWWGDMPYPPYSPSVVV